MIVGGAAVWDRELEFGTNSHVFIASMRLCHVIILKLSAFGWMIRCLLSRICFFRSSSPYYYYFIFLTSSSMTGKLYLFIFVFILYINSKAHKHFQYIYLYQRETVTMLPCIANIYSICNIILCSVVASRIIAASTKMQIDSSGFFEICSRIFLLKCALPTLHTI